MTNEGIQLLQPQIKAQFLWLIRATFQRCLSYRWKLYRQSMHICERNVAIRFFFAAF